MLSSVGWVTEESFFMTAPNRVPAGPRPFEVAEEGLDPSFKLLGLPPGGKYVDTSSPISVEFCESRSKKVGA